jgi:hypothetical protein
MIPVEILQAVRTIVVHAHCPDGLASAIILDDALPGRRIEFMAYGTQELAALEPEEGMLFCDFSPPADRAPLFAAKGAVVLDHHKTAKDVVRQFGHHAFGDEIADPGVCGAVLAFRHVWVPLCGTEARLDLVSRVAHLAGIRDTWQRQSPDWVEACVQADAMRFYPTQFWLPEKPGDTPPFVLRDPAEFRARMATGRISYVRHQEKILRAVEKSWGFTTPQSTRVVLFQNTSFSSDAAELLGENADLVIGFGYAFEDGKKKLLLSTRSHTTFDCSAFAKSLGGGGHTKAAGCAVNVAEGDLNPYEAIRQLIESYETAWTAA